MLTTEPTNRGREIARLSREQLTLEAKRDRLPQACRGPIEEQLAQLGRKLAQVKVGSSGAPKGLGL